MDKLDTYRQIIQQIMARHASYAAHAEQFEAVPICDLKREHYLLIDMGWDRTGRVHAVVFHLHIRDDKIWIEQDGTEYGIAQELLDAGVPKDDIVLAFYRPERRALTGLAVA
jgi:hypothetical protein